MNPPQHPSESLVALPHDEDASEVSVDKSTNGESAALLKMGNETVYTSFKTFPNSNNIDGRIQVSSNDGASVDVFAFSKPNDVDGGKLVVLGVEDKNGKSNLFANTKLTADQSSKAAKAVVECIQAAFEDNVFTHEEAEILGDVAKLIGDSVKDGSDNGSTISASEENDIVLAAQSATNAIKANS